MPSQKELASSVKEILKTADLDNLSAKQVRKQLEKDYGCDLTEHKKFIDKTIMELIDEMESGSEEEKETEINKRAPSPEPEKNHKKTKQAQSSDDDSVSSGSDTELETTAPKRPASKTPAKKRGKTANLNDVSSFAQTSNRACKKINNRGSKTDVRVSPELAKIIGAEVLPMSEISLRLHQEALSRQLHEGYDRMYIVCDEDFKAVFGQDRIRVSTLTNHCKKHIFKIEKEKTAKDKSRSKNSMYSKKLWLSPTLSDVIGYNYMSRHTVVKEMWALIKARGLQDPKNKKFMLVEEDMMPIFKTKRIQTFGMMKYLSGHMCAEENEFEYSREYPEYNPPEEAPSNGSTEGS